MTDINYFRLQHIPTAIFFIAIALYFKGFKKDLNREQIIEISGVVAPPIRYGDVDGSYYIKFKLDSSNFTFDISGSARKAVKSKFGLDRFEEVLQVGQDINMGVDKEEYLKKEKVVSVRYLTLDSTQITTYEDYEYKYNSNVDDAHKYYPYVLIFGFLFLIKGLLGINIRWREDKLKFIDKPYNVNLDKLKDFKLGEYKVHFDKERLVLNIENDNWLKVIINYNDRTIQYRKLWFFVKTKFEDIENFGLLFSEGEVDIAVRTKKGLTFNLINTKSGGFKFLDPNRKQKEKIEYVFLSIFMSTILTHPNK